MLLRQDSSSSSHHLSPTHFDINSEPDYSSLSDFSDLPDDTFMSGQPFQFNNPFYWSQQTPLYNQGHLFSGAPDGGLDYRNQSASGQQQPGEWQVYGDGNFNAGALNYSPQPRLKPHRRALSNSTATSYASTSSPQQYPAAYDTAYLDPNTFGGHSQVHHYPTPTQTPTQDSFMDQGNIRQGRQGSNSMAHRAMKNSAASNDQHQQNAHNFANDYLATPKTTNGDYLEMQQANSGELAFANSHGWMQDDSFFDQSTAARRMPDLSRTVSEICQDELYSPHPNIITTQAQPQQINTATLMNQHRPVMHDRLQAANDARASHSPVDLRRTNSPFPPSPFAANHTYGPLQSGAVGTAASQRQQQKAEADAHAYRQHHMIPDNSAPKTISPQEAYLDDFHDPAEESVHGPPLFPHNASSQQPAFDTRSGYGPVSSEDRRVPTTNFSFHSPMHTSPQGQPNQGFKFASLQQRPSGDSAEDIPTDFPAHLVSMETSKSEPEFESSQESEPVKPADSMAEGGTYTCTYQNCTRRFATPALLQKHKREGHRSSAAAKVEPASPSDGPNSSASPPRNTQAGPHRCDRINPSTGKPCNTIFSRPYDLTRHEDTIHARRGKVHCEYCTEEKTFSRADALTRHMRVVHPNIDFPGKHRRRHVD